MKYQFKQDVMFKHCDPAGIVFYPRYFEMMNDVVESFFKDAINFPYHEMVPEAGVPTAAIQTQFLAPSRLGDPLLIDLTVVKLGRTSAGIHLNALCNGETRFSTELTLVYIDAKGRPQSWPTQARDKLNSYLEG